MLSKFNGDIEREIKLWNGIQEKGSGFNNTNLLLTLASQFPSWCLNFSI